MSTLLRTNVEVLERWVEPTTQDVKQEGRRVLVTLPTGHTTGTIWPAAAFGFKKITDVSAAVTLVEDAIYPALLEETETGIYLIKYKALGTYLYEHVIAADGPFYFTIFGTV
tara:strand:+ start:9636 stop:9971 length:336 start_codon:yes stop_codon:yes gene_type:complete